MSSFAEKVSACIQGFDHLCNDPDIWINSDLEETCRQTSPLQLKNELMRFRVWTANTCAHKRGEGSLEHQLRDASNIRDQVARLLQDLEQLLSDAKGIITGAIIPWDQETHLMELEDDETDDSDSVESFLTEEPLSTELSQVLDGIVEDVNCLFRLSPSIQEPSPHDCFKQASSSDILDLETSDIAYLRREFPVASNAVLERFARTISHQRRYLRDNEARSFKGSVLPQHPNMDHTSSQGPQTTGAEQLDLILGASAAYTEQAPVPDIPEGATNGPFKCPFCSMIISISSRSSWKKHVFSDLNPYICIEESCPAPNQNFQDHHDWVNHIRQYHWRVWSCCFGCEEVFHSSDLVMDHLVEMHSEAATLLLQGGILLSSFVNVCEEPKPEDDSAECPLCKETQSTFVEYRQHIGYHYQDLALFKLPQLSVSDETKYGGQEEEAAEENYASISTSPEAPKSNTPHTYPLLRSEDIIFLKSEGVDYEASFPPFDIDNGGTRVIDVKNRVASIWKMPREKAHRAVLFYEGDELKGLETPIREFGIAHRSTILLALPPSSEPPSFGRNLTVEDFSRPYFSPKSFSSSGRKLTGEDFVRPTLPPTSLSSSLGRTLSGKDLSRSSLTKDDSFIEYPNEPDKLTDMVFDPLGVAREARLARFRGKS
ncbi:hypothetical protein FAVG1_11779 [Fusarium avenaceum]|nr:hypothetical protein FAVG1_11779 [Fusarium avenaceum]